MITKTTIDVQCHSEKNEKNKETKKKAINVNHKINYITQGMKQNEKLIKLESTSSHTYLQ